MHSNLYTQKSLQVIIKNLFSRNRTQDTQDAIRLKANFIIQDKESLYEEMQRLKQENNHLRQTVKQIQSQIQYFKREMHTSIKEEGTPKRNFSRIKNGFLEKITRLEDDNIRLQQQLQESQSYIIQLQSPFNKNNVESLCMSLSEDNMKLSTLIKQQEQAVNQAQNNCAKLSVKYNAIINNYKSIKKLNEQLLVEISELKKKDTLFQERPQQKESKKIEEQLQLDYDQALVDLRNEKNKVKYLENMLKQNQAESQEQIEILEKKLIEQKRLYETLQREVEQEKVQRFQTKRTIILKNNGPLQLEEQDIIQNEDVLQKKKMININKNEISNIARQVKLNLIGQRVSLQDVEEYLLQGEELTQQQLKLNLTNRIFGLNSQEQIEMASIYLADAESETEVTTKARVKSIFKTLMENYSILTIEQLTNINQNINKKKNEISDILMKKYPDTYTNGYISLENYLDILQTIEIQLSKLEIDHFYALITKYNKYPRVLLQQINAPFEVTEEEDQDSEEEINQPKLEIDTNQNDVKLSHSIVIDQNGKDSGLVNLIEDDNNDEQQQQQNHSDNIEEIHTLQLESIQKGQSEIRRQIIEDDEERNPFQDIHQSQEEVNVKLIDSQELRKQSLS